MVMFDSQKNTKKYIYMFNLFIKYEKKIKYN